MAQTTLRDYLQTTEDAINAGEIENALTTCQHILTHFPQLLEAQRLLGEVYLAQGRLDEAQQTLDRVLTNDPENVIAYCSRALVSERKAEYDTALDCYQQAYELSRGNSQIRQEFNQLSAKVGQQGFIFSRAGLARLYMRGDLLSQAIQEWEVILTAAPERLDARTGLLETYWREGSYDCVERVATEILNDVPGCLKALLLLAHVTFAQNALQAQELLQRAADLDPDLITAQELFSDFMVNHPQNPFSALLKKTPTVLPDKANGQYTDQGGTTPQASTGASASGTSHTPTLSDPLAHWSSLDNIIEPQQDYQTMQDASLPFAIWGNNNPAELEPWNNSVPQARSTPPIEELPTQHIHASGSRPSSALDALNTFNPPEQPDEPEAGVQSTASNDTAEYDIWSSFDQPQAPAQAETTHAVQSAPGHLDFDAWSIFGQDDEAVHLETATPAASSSEDLPDLDSWNTLSTEPETTAPQQPGHIAQDTHDDSAAQEQQGNEREQPWYPADTPPVEPENVDASWQSGKKAGNEPAPPAWLDMLASSEPRQPGGGSPKEAPLPAAPSTPVVQEPKDLMVKPSALAEVEPAAKTSPRQEDAHEVVFPGSQLPANDEEPFFFGPEWLKSLGAAVMDSSSSREEVAPQALQPAQPAVTDEAEDVTSTTSFTGEEAMLDWRSSLTSEPSALETSASPDEPHVPETAAIWTPSVESETSKTPAAAAPSDVAETAPESPIPATLPVPSSELAEQSAQAARQVSFERWLDQAAHRLTQSDQNMLTTLEELEKDLRSQGFMPLEQGALSSMAQHIQEPDLSSAFAQFGNYPEQPLKQEQPTSQPQPVQAAQTEVQPETEPLWPTTPPSTSQAAPRSSQTASKSKEASPVSVSHLDALSNYVSRPAPSPQQRVQPEPPSAAPADIELETTMKRPAVRLQTIQQRPAISQAPAKGGTGNRSSSGKAPEEKLGYKDRLLKGYQYQLAGAYDDAMQEYRLVIRNAPDLLGEVISNMRALLKLAPKYAPGYRVLGDAYMRQGEYLQAMEAYNKALTMAKKVKG